ncbi:MAG: hypothetical protein J2P46_20120 [Zavarzinella sp.]|nr:hypothetical protein [Zavarzinella sp.]
MAFSRSFLGVPAVILIALSACDRPTPAVVTPAVPIATTGPASATAEGTTGASTARVPADQSITLGHVRVSVKKVTVGKVPLRAADGSITYAGEPRLMIALAIKNTSDKRKSEYGTWVPDLDSARTVARLTDDRGTELKRVTFGFGNNVKDRTVLDTLTPGKSITDLLVFEIPAMEATYLDLDLPGANCGVPGTFRFRIDTKAINRSRER